jgi:tRNA A37 threonylcarbamoyladenosine biosynthesis protein TsaE
VKFIGGENLIKECTDAIVDYFNKGFRNIARTDESKPYLLSVRGELGSGKTLFGRALVTSI